MPSLSHTFPGHWFSGALLIAALAAAPGVRAQDEESGGDFAAAEAAGAARKAWADNNFDAIMVPQNEAFLSAVNPPAAPLPAAPESGEVAFDQAMGEYRPSPSRTTVPAPECSLAGGCVTVSSQVEVPLDEWRALRDRVGEVRDRAVLVEGPTVALGSSEYSGRSIPGALELRVRLQVTLGKPGRYKTVPLIGEDVVLVRAAVAGKRIPVARLNGYHVWATRADGEVTVDLDVLVPARGPRGSLEYDFLVPRTPVTQVSLAFPGEELEPRLDGAVRAEVRPDGGSTRLEATLQPTTRIHLVGFKDLGQQEDAEARVFAETLNLLSVDEGALDLFTVVRYTILYAGARRFDLIVPAGTTVVSADGEGAFRFTLEDDPEGRGTIVRGETAFPIRNKYEISLRLRQQLPKQEVEFDAPLPRCIGVEREHGWLAVEVPGKLKLGERESRDVVAVDVRQLPEEMMLSAVSPIIRAYRYHAADPRVRLSAIRLPEVEPASASVDRVRALSTLSPEGRLITDMRITLRNRLRPSLALTLPAGAEVRSVHLDGDAIRPSRDGKGRLVLPLKRSEGGDRLEPFTIRVVYEDDAAALGLAGSSTLELPALELPVSTVAWTVFLPARNVYGELRGDVEPQVFRGEGAWHRPAHSVEPIRVAPAGDGDDMTEDAGGETAGGLVGVRIELPRDGVRLDYSRYWVEGGRPLAVSFFYARSWLPYPAGVLLVLLAALAVFLFSTAPAGASARRWIAVALGGLVSWPAWQIDGATLLVAGALVGLGVAGLRRRWFVRVVAALRGWVAGLPAGFAARERPASGPTTGRIVKLVLVGTGLTFFGLLALAFAVDLIDLLGNPL